MTGVQIGSEGHHVQMVREHLLAAAGALCLAGVPAVTIAGLPVYASTQNPVQDGQGQDQDGQGQDQNGPAVATPELPAGVLVAIGLVPLAAGVYLFGRRRRRPEATD